MRWLSLITVAVTTMLLMSASLAVSPRSGANESGPTFPVETPLDYAP